MWPSVVYDKWDEDRWVRDRWVPAWGGFYRLKYSYLPITRMETWSRLIEAWPHGFSASIEQSLSFYYQSVIDRPEHPAKGLTGAAIAFESLLGRGLDQELRHRLSQRGALLVARGAEAREVYRLLKGWYDDRSKLVHDAVVPTAELVVRFQQFLMRAIPSMVRLTQLAGSHENAIRALDEASFDGSAQLDGLFDENGWWSFVDLMKALEQPAL
jgi:hypothetical protein